MWVRIPGTGCYIISTRKTLLRGQLKDGMYVFFLWNYTITASPQDLLGEHASSSVWHERLGHPSTRVVSSVLSQHQLPFLPDRAGSPLCPPVSKEKVTVFLFCHLPRLLLLL